MKGIKTLEEALALPERSNIRVRRTQNPDGSVTLTPAMPEIVSHEVEGDDIILFKDKDGRGMTIEYDSEGAYKTPSGW